MREPSAPELLVLHAVRLLGLADAAAVSRRFGLDPAVAGELLLDEEAMGRVTWSGFAGVGGWSLTERGVVEGERRLAEELAAAPDAAVVVRGVHAEFEPLNARLLQACTDWQLRPTAADPLAPNDHGDGAWDARVLRELVVLDEELAPLVERLRDVLVRFDGYDRRFSAAVSRARGGVRDAVAAMDNDSCHRVWFELHEDLLATLGRRRGGAG